MDRYNYNVDVHLPGGKVLLLGVEAVGGLSTREEIQLHYATQVYPKAERILVTPVMERASPVGGKSAKLAGFVDRHVLAVERLRRMREDLKDLPESVPPGARHGPTAFRHPSTIPAELEELLRQEAVKTNPNYDPSIRGAPRAEEINQGTKVSPPTLDQAMQAGDALPDFGVDGVPRLSAEEEEIIGQLYQPNRPKKAPTKGDHQSPSGDSA